MAKKRSRVAMEPVTFRLPKEVYQLLTDYCDRNGGLTDSEGVRQIVTNALNEDRELNELKEFADCQHRVTREELRRLAALILNNMAADTPMSKDLIPDMIRQTIQIARDRALETD